jgi:serine/threonine protein kinase
LRVAGGRQMVAVKKVCHIFDNALATRRVLREIKLLRALRHPNIISCSDVLYPRNSSSSTAYLPGGGFVPFAGVGAEGGGRSGGGGLVSVPGGSPPTGGSNTAAGAEGAAPAPAPATTARSSKLDRVYIVTEFVDTDLHRVIRSQQLLTPKHVQYFMFQALCALDYMHRRNVIHRGMSCVCV